MNTLTKALMTVTLMVLSACGSKKEAAITAQDSNSVFGGEELNENEEIASYIVGIYNPVDKYICTGSLIDDDMVLTAAHCVVGDPKNIIIFFGPRLEKGVEVRQVANGAIHARYRRDKSFSNGDIAILKFTGDLPVGYMPIELLEDSDEVKPGTEALFAGYGISDIIKKEGSGTLRWILGDVSQGFWSRTEASVKQSVKGGICSGDSGGPAMSLVNDRWVQWGVTSRGYTTAAGPCTGETYFTRVDVYLTWINKAAEVLRAAGQ